MTPKICPICDAGDPTNVIQTCEHMKTPPAPAPKFKNPHRLSVKETLANEGFETFGEFAASPMATDSVVPACCDEGCQVEPDGRCEHGCPSVLLALGVI